LFFAGNTKERYRYFLLVKRSFSGSVEDLSFWQIVYTLTEGIVACPAGPPLRFCDGRVLPFRESSVYGEAPATGAGAIPAKAPWSVKSFLIISPEPEDPYSSPEKIVFKKTKNITGYSCAGHR
jgi:hypothetical protein